MAYADSIRAATATTEEIASLIDGALVSFSSVNANLASATSFATSGYLTTVDRTVSVGSGQSVLVLAFCSFSNNTSNASVGMRIHEDTVNALNSYGYGRSFRSDTSGLDQMMYAHLLKTPSVGSHTYQMYIETAGSTTAYIRMASLSIITFRTG